MILAPITSEQLRPQKKKEKKGVHREDEQKNSTSTHKGIAVLTITRGSTTTTQEFGFRARVRGRA